MNKQKILYIPLAIMLIAGFLGGVVYSHDFLPNNVDSHLGTINLLNSTITNYPLANYSVIAYNNTNGNEIHLVGFTGYNFTFYKNNAFVSTETIVAETLEFIPGENITNWRVYVNYENLQVFLYESASIDDINFATLFTISGLFSFWSDYWSVMAYGVIMLFPLSLWTAKSSLGSIAIAYMLIASLGFAMPSNLWFMIILPASVSAGTVLYLVFWGNRQAQQGK